MIVKKMPILQGFPTPDTVKFLSSTELKLSEFTPVFYDIETTGLSRYSTFVYLIGAVKWEQNQWILTQWLGESPEEEALIIREFTNYLQDSTYTSLILKNAAEKMSFRLHLKDSPQSMSIRYLNPVKVCLNYHE